MSNDVINISASTPVLEGPAQVTTRFSRDWYNVFAAMVRKLRILDGASTTSATAGTASALPGLPAGYMTINDLTGTPRKVPYYDV